MIIIIKKKTDIHSDISNQLTKVTLIHLIQLLLTHTPTHTPACNANLLNSKPLELIGSLASWTPVRVSSLSLIHISFTVIHWEISGNSLCTILLMCPIPERSTCWWIRPMPMWYILVTNALQNLWCFSTFAQILAALCVSFKEKSIPSFILMSSVKKAIQYGKQSKSNLTILPIFVCA